MNIFKYIKYSGTDIRSEVDLRSVPDEIVENYYLKINSTLYGLARVPSVEVEVLCTALVMWITDQDAGPERFQIGSNLFLEALKERCEDEPL